MMKRIALSEYLAVPEDYRGAWDTERWDIPGWETKRKSHMGKRTLLDNINGATCQLVEGLSLEIVDDTAWKKPEEVQKEIDSLYMEYRSENGHEPHYADCIIRWRDTLETEEERIALAMDSDTEMDEEIFFYCDSINDLKSLADNGKGDFTVIGCLGFGIYEELL